MYMWMWDSKCVDINLRPMKTHYITLKPNILRSQDESEQKRKQRLCTGWKYEYLISR